MQTQRRSFEYRRRFVSGAWHRRPALDPTGETSAPLCCHGLLVRAFCAAGLVAVLILQPVGADDTAGLKTPTGSRKIELWPIPGGERPARRDEPIDLGGWAYQATRSNDPREGVPWQLIVTPSGKNADLWQQGLPDVRSLVSHSHTAKLLVDRVKVHQEQETLPVVHVPEVLWKQWMSPDLHDVVGIHFHEFVTDDVARILYTLHKVPPDKPDGTPSKAQGNQGRSGVRIEATLLAPIQFSLDQSVVIRVDPLEKEKAEGRADHELGHARVSQEVFLDVLRGPQDWDAHRCTGRRSHLAYYWRIERIGRSWQGYKRGIGKIATLRTSVVLVPPSRWSMMLPIPPERVTQKHLQTFNDAIVRLPFPRVDSEAQDRFHAHHGAYD
ncbi:MAG: hypothetical protein ABII12_13255 [Planctomycetota bacterium]